MKISEIEKSSMIEECSEKVESLEYEVEYVKRERSIISLAKAFEMYVEIYKMAQDILWKCDDDSNMESLENVMDELKDVCFEDSRLKQAYDLLMDEACEELC